MKLAAPEEMRAYLFRGFQGCANHGCVVTGPKAGMATNGTCQCVTNASRSQLTLLQERMKSTLAQIEKEAGCAHKA